VIGITSAPWKDMPARIASKRAGLILLSDPDLKIIRDYGLEHVTFDLKIARPAAFLIGADQKIKWRALPDTWRHRLNAKDVMDLYPPQGQP